MGCLRTSAPHSPGTEEAPQGEPLCGSADPYECGCDPAVMVCPTFFGFSARAAQGSSPRPVPLRVFRTGIGDSSLSASVEHGGKPLIWSDGQQFRAWRDPQGRYLALRQGDDGGWGYPDGRADLLAVPANTLVQVHLDDSKGSTQYPDLTLRIHSERQIASFTIWWRTQDAEVHTVSVRTPNAEGWQVLSTFLLGASGWSVEDRVTDVGLRFPGDVLLDFVALHD